MNAYKSFIMKFNQNIMNLCSEFYDESDSELREMYTYSVYSGRRYRPILVLTGKLICDATFDDTTIKLATAVELIHKYSLILDDAVDNDPLRRGEKTYYQKYGRNNAYAMSAYLMNLFCKELSKIERIFCNEERGSTIRSFYEDILSDMSVGFISDLNKKSRDIRGVRNISDMQTTTLLRNSLLIGFISSDYYSMKDSAYILKTIMNLGNYMGIVFQAYNDIEVFYGTEFQKSNKGNLFPDFYDNRKNIILAKVPVKIVAERDTSMLIDYINKNKLFDEVFSEVSDTLKNIRIEILKLPKASTGREFLMQFLNEKEKSIDDLSKEDIFNFNDTKKIGII
jgi:heptaprenyl diphosphate synthase